MKLLALGRVLLLSRRVDLAPVRRADSVAMRPPSAGSALVAVLWSVVLLSVVVFGVLETTQLDLRVAKNFGDRTQAHYLALSGVETAKALIYQEREERKVVGTSFRSQLLNDERAFRQVELGRGYFSVIRRGGQDEGEHSVFYGLLDEERHLNVNTASAEELDRLPGIEPDVAAALVDWRDRDDEPSPQGAEQEYYSSLDRPYAVRNGPFETLRELLMVRGVAAPAFLGEDANANGILDPGERDRDRSPPLDNGDLVLDRGWSSYLSTDSGMENVNAAGERRVNIQRASADELAKVDGISSDLAEKIVAWRGSNSLESIVDLLNVTNRPSNNQNRAAGSGAESGGSTTTTNNSADASTTLNLGGGNAAQGSGQKLIDLDLLKSIADDVTVSDDEFIPGAVNVNTATDSVLASLSGWDEETARNIVTHRDAQGPFETVAHLMDVAGMTNAKLKSVASRLAVRPSTYRIRSEGVVPTSSARGRVEIVLRFDGFSFEILSYQEIQ